MASTAILAELEKAADGLLFPSESDYPLQAFLWLRSEVGAGALVTPEELLKYKGYAADTAVEAVDFERFFRNVIQEEDWHEEEERASARRFRALVETLQRNLSDLKVFKVGRRKRDVYVVGRTPADDFAGFSTTVVET
jgi:hypothetical protein